jgi:hypothetical protein
MSHVQHDERAAAILGRKASGLLALDEVLAELADADCAEAIAAEIAERVRLRPDAVLRALDAESDEAIAVMCRAGGFTNNSFSALLRMRRRRNRGTDSEPTRALSQFAGLSRPAALRILAGMGAGQGKAVGSIGRREAWSWKAER